MSFVNEYISAEDFEKYQLREIDQNHVVGGVNARQWTVDRWSDSYLRRLTRGREEWAHVSDWTFRWSGADYTLHFHLVGASGRPWEPGSIKWALIRVNGQDAPSRLPEPQPEFLRDLKSALTVYKDGGIYAQSTDFTVELVVGDEVRP
jgi:hypothetical protein